VRHGKERGGDTRTSRSRGDKAFDDEVFDALDAPLERGADPDLMLAALGTKMAEVLARCIHDGRMPQEKAEAWGKQQQAMLHKSPWTFVQELQAQPKP